MSNKTETSEVKDDKSRKVLKNQNLQKYRLRLPFVLAFYIFKDHYGWFSFWNHFVSVPATFQRIKNPFAKSSNAIKRVSKYVSFNKCYSI